MSGNRRQKKVDQLGCCVNNSDKRCSGFKKELEVERRNAFKVNNVKIFFNTEVERGGNNQR